MRRSLDSWVKSWHPKKPQRTSKSASGSHTFPRSWAWPSLVSVHFSVPQGSQSTKHGTTTGKIRLLCFPGASKRRQFPHATISFAADQKCFDRASTANHVKLQNIAFRCPNCHVLGNFSAGIEIELDLKAKGHKGPKDCTNSIREQFRLPRRSTETKPRISHETVVAPYQDLVALLTLQ